VDGRNLTDIINEKHENVKYLPGVKLPDNIKAVPNLLQATKGADLLIFVLPHQESTGEPGLPYVFSMLIPLSFDVCAVYYGNMPRIEGKNKSPCSRYQYE
jgi:hypothetical protein